MDQAPLHVHEECLEISLCLRGDLEVESNGRTLPSRPGMMFVAGPDDLHRIKSYPKGMCKYWFLFRIPEPGFPLLNLPDTEAHELTQALTALSGRAFRGNDEVRRLFKKLFCLASTLPTGSSARTLRLRSAVLSLFLAVVDAATAQTHDRAEVKIKKLAEDMRRHPEERYPIDDIAERLGLSPSNLLIRFKRFTGMPPHSYLIEQRILRAKDLLRQGIAVSTVAHRLGFSSGQHFSACFKSITGKTPVAFCRTAARVTSDS